MLDKDLLRRIAGALVHEGGLTQDLREDLLGSPGLVQALAPWIVEAASACPRKRGSPWKSEGGGAVAAQADSPTDPEEEIQL